MVKQFKKTDKTSKKQEKRTKGKAKLVKHMTIRN